MKNPLKRNIIMERVVKYVTIPVLTDLWVFTNSFFPNNEISIAIGEGSPTSEIRKLANKHGFTPLVEDALEKVHEGETTLEEVARRIGPKFPHA